MRLLYTSLLTFFFFIYSNLVNAQAPNIKWQKSFGGSGYDYATSVKPTPDGGYIVVGNTTSNDGDIVDNHGGSVDICVIKLDSLGDVKWKKCYGGSGAEIANDIQLTSDGGYVVTGYTTSTDGDLTGIYNHIIASANTQNGDYWILKITSNGIVQWQKCLGGTGDDQAHSIQQTSDGGFIVAGTSASNDGDVTGNHPDLIFPFPNNNSKDFWVVKLDGFGNIKWQKSLGGGYYEQAFSVNQTNDGGYIVAGSTQAYDGGDVAGTHNPVSTHTLYGDFWVVKLTSTGNIQWAKVFGGTSSDQAWSVQQTSDGGYIVAGDTNSKDIDVINLHGSTDFWIIKLNNTGTILWQKTYGGSNTQQARAIQQTSDGGFIVAGHSSSNNGDVSGYHLASSNIYYFDMWVLKIDGLGNIEWQRCYGGTGQENAFCIRQAQDGSYIIAGNSNSTDGDVTNNHGDQDFWIVKLGVPTCLDSISIASSSNYICAGNPITFTATATNGGPTPIFQWKLNGANVGTNSQTFTTSTLADNDVITCTLTSSLACASLPTVTSLPLTMHLGTAVLPSISIAMPYNSVCPDSLAKFKAVISAGIISPIYQWKINGINVGTNSPTFSYLPINLGDVVTCTLTTNGCSAINTVTSNAVLVALSQGTSITSLNIAAAQNPICPNTNAIIKANPLKVGSLPSYQWKLNGTNVGPDSIIYTSASLKSNDVISCVMTSYSGCGEKLTATSNNVTMQLSANQTPTVAINLPSNNICQGDAAVFTAISTNGGTKPTYQWSLNNNNVGNNTNTYTNNSLANGDIVGCTMISNANCAINPAVANPITVSVTQFIQTSLTIAASKNPICAGENVTFTPTATNGGSLPAYNWSLNGIAVSTSSIFSTTTLVNGDKINCKMISNIGCATATVSQDAIMKVYPLPIVTFTPAETVIFYGSTIQLKPIITGNISAYNWTPSIYLDNPNIANPTSSTLENEVYKLTATTSDACTASNDIKIIVFRDLVMPTAFTPNGDGNNDVFRIPSIYQSIIIHNFSIFNRYGKKFFETNDLNKGWDGTINGGLQSSGTYIWMIEYENPITKQTKTINGTVTLIR